jgi:hypothetical protein
MSRGGGGPEVATDRQVPREDSSWGAVAGGRSRADLSACDSL